MGGLRCIRALAAVAVLASSCAAPTTQRETQDTAEMAAVDPVMSDSMRRYSVTANQEVRAEPLRSLLRHKPASEPGSRYCCGNRGFKLEIVCHDLLLKCFQRNPNGWKYVVGRHCKRSLGDTCYLNGCDDVCN